MDRLVRVRVMIEIGIGTLLWGTCPNMTNHAMIRKPPGLAPLVETGVKFRVVLWIWIGLVVVSVVKGIGLREAVLHLPEHNGECDD